jgi:molybdenum cofactor cytidylyltransferase
MNPPVHPTKFKATFEHEARSQRMKVDCLILAAGESARYGGCKLLALLRGKTLLDTAIANVAALPLQSVNLVTGAYHREIAQHFAFDDTSKKISDQNSRIEYSGNQTTTLHEIKPVPRLIKFEDWQQGMGHSIAYGVSQLPTDNAVLILLGDQPLISAQDLQRLFTAWQKNPTQTVCASFNNIRGVPALFPANAKRELLTLSGDKGARSLLAKDTWPVTTVAMANAAFDIDTPNDIENFLTQQKKTKQ